MRAPYDALVKERLADIGQFVSPGVNVAKLVSVEVAKVRLPIPQGKLSYIKLPKIGGEDGEIIDLYTDTSGEIRHWTATLNRTEGVFDERSRTLFAVAYVEDPYALKSEKNYPLRIGTFVNANILGRAIENLVVLPKHILRTGNEVLIVDENNKLRARKVTLLRTGGDLAFVFRNRSQAEPYSEKIDPREAERLSDFIKEGGFEYMSDVKPREIIDSIRSDVNTKKYVKTPEGWR